MTMSDQSTMANSSRVQLVFGILLSGFMAIIFSGFIPFLSLGFTTEWLHAWITGILIGWPLGFVIVSLVNRPLMRLAVLLTGFAQFAPSK